MSDIPKPGSAAAISLGCLCPTMDNAGGEGIILNGERVFWYTVGCPVHKAETLKEGDHVLYEVEGGDD